MNRVGYLRISGQDQADGLSPEIQREALRRAGCSEVFEDLGRSGYSGRLRPGFEALLDAIGGGSVAQVVCNTYSRLSRNAKDSARLDDALLAAGATVLDLQTGQTHEPAELTPELLALLARQESRQKSKRQKQTFDRMRAEGLSTSSKAPWGLRLPTRASILRGDDPPDAQERVIIRDPVTYPISRQLVEYYLRTGCTTADLLRWALENGAPFRARSGITHWLEHPLVQQHVLQAGEVSSIRSIKARHKSGWKSPTPKSEPHWLRGLVVCDCCSRPMAAANRRSALRCAIDACPQVKQVRIELVMWAVSAACVEASGIASDRLLDAVRTRESSAAERQLEGQLVALRKAVAGTPSLEQMLRPQISMVERQLATAKNLDVSHWRILSQNWVQSLDTWDWYVCPRNLKPRIYRALVDQVRCSDGRVVSVRLRGDYVAKLPETWPTIDNRGVTYGLVIDERGKEKAAVLTDEGADLLNWHGLLDATPVDEED